MGSEVRTASPVASGLLVLARRGASDLASLNAKSDEARRKRAVPGVQYQQLLEKSQRNLNPYLGRKLVNWSKRCYHVSHSLVDDSHIH